MNDLKGYNGCDLTICDSSICDWMFHYMSFLLQRQYIISYDIT